MKRHVHPPKLTHRGRRTLIRKAAKRSLVTHQELHSFIAQVDNLLTKQLLTMLSKKSAFFHTTRNKPLVKEIQKISGLEFDKKTCIGKKKCCVQMTLNNTMLMSSQHE